VHALAEAEAHGAPLPIELRHRYAIRCFGEIVQSYRPGRTFKGRFLLLRTSDPGARDRGWAPHVHGRVDVLQLPVFHYQLLEDEAVQRTGRAIAEFLATLEIVPAW